MKFEEFGFSDEILDALFYMGFEKATPIQEQAIPEILKGHDILASAQTGTGKTAAFLLPILDRISRSNSGQTQVLIVVPTRELALQIDQQIQGFTYTTAIESISLYGGGDGVEWEEQSRALKKGVHIVVATPGKLISFINNKHFNGDTVKYLILDEADRMLDIGFYEDIISIINALPKERQTLLFSATMPDKIVQLSKKILNDPKRISIAISKPAEKILQATYLCYDEQKVPLLIQLIKDKPAYKSIIIFSSTKKNVSTIVSALKRKGLEAAAISSDLDQKQREEVLLAFRAKNIRILVATDVISRGIDIKDINLVINYNVPRDAEDYVHRIGRTARADTSGVAITLINPDDMRHFHAIEKLIEKEVIKMDVPPALGESPEWQKSGPRRGGGGGRSRNSSGRAKPRHKGNRKGGSGNRKRPPKRD
ncbi:MAG: DEAD/DEAH box helicase [Saprospiraceae bacterium]|nr:DEAD/DEAH box helicase [Saprospiraceae bacterium]